jgi:DNA-3-methyladenine glycosylase II
MSEDTMVTKNAGPVVKGLPTTPKVITRQLAEQDPVIDALIHRFGFPVFPKPTEEPFATLVRAITQQQIATSAAHAIHGRLVEALGGAVTAEGLTEAPAEVLQAAGLSGATVAAVKDLSAKTVDGTLHLDPDQLSRLGDEQIAAELTSVLGIGPWTADMFLMFQLRRPDIWPVGDLALRKGIAQVWQMPIPTPKELAAFGEQFRPYRSVVAWYGYQAAHAPNTTTTRSR